MTKPQLEDGYTRIANEILEALVKRNLSPYESRVLWFIIRKTYGWQKKDDLISLSQIVVGTDIKKGHASRALSSLISKQIVTRLGNKRLGFNKDYDSWLLKLPAEEPSETNGDNSVSEVTSSGNNLGEGKLPAEEPKLPAEEPLPTSSRVPVEEPQKIKTKETIQKKLYGEFLNVKLSDAEHQKLIEKFGEAEAKELIENCSAYLASKGDKYKDHYATIQNWARRDGSQAKGGTGGKNRRALKTDGWKDWAKFASPGDAPEYLRQGAGDSEDATSMGSQPPLPLPP